MGSTTICWLQAPKLSPPMLRAQIKYTQIVDLKH